MPNAYVPVGGRVPLYHARLALDVGDGDSSGPERLLESLSARMWKEAGAKPDATQAAQAPGTFVFADQWEDALHAVTVFATLAIGADPTGRHDLRAEARTSCQALPGRIATLPMPCAPRLMLAALDAAQAEGLAVSASGVPMSLGPQPLAPDTLQEALACLASPARLVPVVLVVSKPGGGWAADPAAIARTVAGAAPTWTFDASDASLDAMAELLVGKGPEPSEVTVFGPTLTGAKRTRASIASGLTTRVASLVARQVMAELAAVEARMVAEVAMAAAADDAAGEVRA